MGLLDIDSEEPSRKRREFKTVMAKRTIMIDDERLRYAYEIGEGNISEGIRQCIDRCKSTKAPD